MTDFDPSALEGLAPEVRARVNEALKQTLDAELAATDPSILPARGFSRSQGSVFFSRSKIVYRAQASETQVMGQIGSMDDAAFAKFAERLATLKQVAKEG